MCIRAASSRRPIESPPRAAFETGVRIPTLPTTTTTRPLAWSQCRHSAPHPQRWHCVPLNLPPFCFCQPRPWPLSTELVLRTRARKDGVRRTTDGARGDGHRRSSSPLSCRNAAAAVSSSRLVVVVVVVVEARRYASAPPKGHRASPPPPLPLYRRRRVIQSCLSRGKCRQARAAINAHARGKWPGRDRDLAVSTVAKK